MSTDTDWIDEWKALLKREEPEAQHFVLHTSGNTTNTLTAWPYNKKWGSVAEFRTSCDLVYKQAMQYVIDITLNTELNKEEQSIAVGEVVANLYNAIIKLDPVLGEKELSEYGNR
jgi:hypothetical protein